MWSMWRVMKVTGFVNECEWEGSLFSWFLGVTSYNLDSFSRDCICLQLGVHRIYNKCPHIVAKAVCIQMALFPWRMSNAAVLTNAFHWSNLTLNTALLLTLLVRASVMLLSKVTKTFIASWGLMWPLWMSSSNESVNAMPMLDRVSQFASHILHAPQ